MSRHLSLSSSLSHPRPAKQSLSIITILAILLSITFFIIGSEGAPTKQHASSSNSKANDNQQQPPRIRCPGASDQSSVMALQRAWSTHFNSGRYVESRLCLLRIEQITGLNPELACELGKLSGVVREYDASAFYLEKCVKDGPQPPSAHVYYELGNAYFVAGRLGEALEMFEAVLKQQPKSAMSYNNIGQIYFADKDFAQAAAAYEKALEINPTLIHTYVNLQAAMEGNGDEPGAIDVRRRKALAHEAIADSAKSTAMKAVEETRNTLALLRAKMKEDKQKELLKQKFKSQNPGIIVEDVDDDDDDDKQETQEQINAKIAANKQQIVPSFALPLAFNVTMQHYIDAGEIHAELGAMMLDENVGPLARQHYENGTRILSKAETLVNETLGANWTVTGDDGKHRNSSLYRSIFASVLYNIGSIEMAAGMNNESVAHLEKAVALSGNHSRYSYHNNLAVVHSNLENTEQAIYHFNRAVELNPNFTTGYLNMANIFRKRTQYYAALLTFEKAYQLEANSSEAFNGLVEMYDRVGLPFKSIQLYRTRLSTPQFENDPVSLTNLLIAQLKTCTWEGLSVLTERVMDVLDKEVHDWTEYAQSIDAPSYSSFFNDRLKHPIRLEIDPQQQPTYPGAGPTLKPLHALYLPTSKQQVLDSGRAQALEYELITWHMLELSVKEMENNVSSYNSNSPTDIKDFYKNNPIGANGEYYQDENSGDRLQMQMRGIVSLKAVDVGAGGDGKLEDIERVIQKPRKADAKDMPNAHRDIIRRSHPNLTTESRVARILREKKAAAAAVASKNSTRDATADSSLLLLKENPYEAVMRQVVFNKTEVVERIRKRGGKLTVGWVSGEFNMHPVSLAIAGIFANQNRSEFSVNIYPTTFSDKSAIRHFIGNSSDFERSLEKSTPVEAWQAIRHEDNVDILIDLMGWTGAMRSDLFILRSAPVQLFYLGIAATLGSSYTPSNLVDRFVAPPRDSHFFTERFIYMPHSFMATAHAMHSPHVLAAKRTDWNTVVSPLLSTVLPPSSPFYPSSPTSQNTTTASSESEPPKTEEIYTREKVGLPNDVVVFAAFSQQYKVDPAVWETWMNVLRRVPNSVLWMLDYGSHSKDGLTDESQARGIPSLASNARTVDSTAIEDTKLEAHTTQMLDDGSALKASTVESGQAAATAAGSAMDQQAQQQLLSSIAAHSSSNSSSASTDPNALFRRVYFTSLFQKEHHHQVKMLADLAFDTFHYGGHVTSVDTLYSGIPLLSLPGDMYSARVSGSLVRAMNMEKDLIVSSLRELEDRAVSLAQNRSALAELRQKTETSRANAPLFDNAMWTRNLDKGLRMSFERWAHEDTKYHVIVNPEA